MTASSIGSSRFDPKGFRDSLGCFPTGVAVVTTLDANGAPVGLTVNSFNSVSMAPPLVLWSLKLDAGCLPVFRACKGFAVNVLAANQIKIARQFSKPVEDRFAHVPWQTGESGFPVLDGTAAFFECQSSARYPGGDHEIFLGEVLRHSSADREPLVFGKGRLVPLPPDTT